MYCRKVFLNQKPCHVIGVLSEGDHPCPKWSFNNSAFQLLANSIFCRWYQVSSTCRMSFHQNTVLPRSRPHPQNWGQKVALKMEPAQKKQKTWGCENWHFPLGCNSRSSPKNVNIQKPTIESIFQPGLVCPGQQNEDQSFAPKTSLKINLFLCPRDTKIKARSPGVATADTKTSMQLSIAVGFKSSCSPRLITFKTWVNKRFLQRDFNKK